MDKKRIRKGTSSLNKMIKSDCLLEKFIVKKKLCLDKMAYDRTSIFDFTD